MSTLNTTFRPIQAWPKRGLTPSSRRRRSPFKAGYTDTLNLLSRELRHLGARRVVIQMAVPEDQILRDGSRPYAHARPDHPGVIIAFEGKHGPMQMPCDEFTDWQANLRAIALTLERLRLADLYGVTKHGEQYTGWKRIAAPAPESGPHTPHQDPPITNVIDACIFIASTSGATADHHLLAQDVELYRSTYKKAAAELHPDRNGGDDRLFKRLQQAREVLDRRHGL